jgi:hypothetical protein
MRALSRITIYGVFLLSLLGSALGQNVQTDFDHQVNFSQYKSFSWAVVGLQFRRYTQNDTGLH